MDEIIKNKYKNLKYNVYTLKKKTAASIELCNRGISTFKENILIDDKIPNIRDLNKLQQDLNEIIYEINNKLLPAINAKSN